jgi:hypothetical protein
MVQYQSFNSNFGIFSISKEFVWIHIFMNGTVPHYHIRLQSAFLFPDIY